MLADFVVGDSGLVWLLVVVLLVFGIIYLARRA